MCQFPVANDDLFGEQALHRHPAGAPAGAAERFAIRGDHEHDTLPSGARGKLVLSASQRAAAAARLNPPAVAEAPAPVPKAATSTGEQRAAEEQQAVEAQAAAEVGAKAARQQIEQRRLAAVRQVEAILCERFPAVCSACRGYRWRSAFIVKSARELATKSPPGR
jgi:hypothetical protein